MEVGGEEGRRRGHAADGNPRQGPVAPENSFRIRAIVGPNFPGGNVVLQTNQVNGDQGFG